MRKRIRELEAAITPFVRVYRLNEPLAANWPEDKPLADCVPGVWPTWADLRRCGAAMEGKALKERP